MNTANSPPKLLGFMGSLLFLTDLLTAHEPELRKPLEINKTIFRFMGSLCCGISLDPRKPAQQPGMVLTVASRLDLMYTHTPRILRCFPTVKLCVAVGEAEIAAAGMAVGGYITPQLDR